MIIKHIKCMLRCSINEWQTNIKNGQVHGRVNLLICSHYTALIRYTATFSNLQKAAVYRELIVLPMGM